MLTLCNIQLVLLHQKKKCFGLYLIHFTNLPLTSFPPSVQYAPAVDYGESYDYYDAAIPTDTPNEFSESQVKRKKKKTPTKRKKSKWCMPAVVSVVSACHVTSLVLISSVIC